MTIRSTLLRDSIVALSLEGCRGADTAELIRVGLAVKDSIAEYRTLRGEHQRPDPACQSVEDSVGYSDFEIVRRDDFIPRLAKVQAQAPQINAVLAYVLISTYDKEIYLPEELVLSFLVQHSFYESRKVLQEVVRLQPIAAHGEIFLKNRKQGRLQPVNASIKKFLMKHPDASAKMVWESLSVKPPRGHSFCDNRLGKYIEKDGATVMSWGRFKNVVSEHRPKRTKP